MLSGEDMLDVAANVLGLAESDLPDERDLVSEYLSTLYEPNLTTPSALNGTSQPETPSKKPPANA